MHIASVYGNDTIPSQDVVSDVVKIRRLDGIKEMLDRHHKGEAIGEEFLMNKDGEVCPLGALCEASGEGEWIGPDEIKAYIITEHDEEHTSEDEDYWGSTKDMPVPVYDYYLLTRKEGHRIAGNTDIGIYPDLREAAYDIAWHMDIPEEQVDEWDTHYKLSHKGGA